MVVYTVLFSGRSHFLLETSLRHTTLGEGPNGAPRDADPPLSSEFSSAI